MKKYHINLLKALINDINQSAAWSHYEGTMYNKHGYSKFDYFIFACFNYLQYLVLSWYCEKINHKWIDESYGNADSGCISMYCKRCGHSYHESLY
jgi:hypothetical protein